VVLVFGLDFLFDNFDNHIDINVQCRSLFFNANHIDIDIPVLVTVSPPLLANHSPGDCTSSFQPPTTPSNNDVCLRFPVQLVSLFGLFYAFASRHDRNWNCLFGRGLPSRHRNECPGFSCFFWFVFPFVSLLPLFAAVGRFRRFSRFSWFSWFSWRV